jgi:hypothetical protein
MEFSPVQVCGRPFIHLLHYSKFPHGGPMDRSVLPSAFREFIATDDLSSECDFPVRLPSPQRQCKLECFRLKSEAKMIMPRFESLLPGFRVDGLRSHSSWGGIIDPGPIVLAK